MEAIYNALIEIRVPKTDGTEGIGTGYPVATNRILTARHVLHPEDRDEAKRIEVRWYYKEGKAHQFCPINGIAWEGKEKEVDVAVLDCTFPENALSFLSLTRIKLAAHARWDSQGFARAAPSRDYERKPVGLQGTTHAMADLPWHFEVDVDTPPEIKEGWAGGSGCPVFVGNRILGVVVETLGNFAQKKLKAIAIWRLLDAFEDFCREVGLDTQAEREKQLEPYRQKIAHELRQTPAARDELEHVVGVIPLGEGDPAERMARALLDLPDLSACEALHKVFVASLQTSPDVAAAISRIANLVLPAVLDEKDTAEIRGRKDVRAAVPLHCYTRTLAELIMARCDGREAKFRSLIAGEKWLRGIHEICQEPESGISRGAAGDIQNFQMLLEQLCLDREEIEDYGDEEKVSEIQIRLRKISEYAKKYYTFRSRDFESDVESKVMDINQKYPEIVFLVLSKPVACANRDANLLYGDTKQKMLSYASEAT